MRATGLLVLTFAAGALLAGCGRGASPGDAIDPAAEGYVRLALAVGRHDPNYVDAYYGPKAWKEDADRGDPVPIPELLGRARDLLARVRAAAPSDRREFLEKQVVSLEGFLRRLSGERMTLTEEARLLYDIDPPVHPVEEFEAARAGLESLLPGEGDLAVRLKAFRDRFNVPADRLPKVADACLAELRRRTGDLVALPAGESFRTSFVTGKPWGAYNWYQGGMTSLIEVNTDLPKTLESVFGTLAHEGYPGHHTMNALLEERLVKGKGWSEFTVSPLYSPISLITEGTANAGIEIVATDAERVAFLRDVLAPLAGLSGLDFERFERVRKAMKPLKYAGGEAARLLLDEGKSEAEVLAFLRRYALDDEARARKSIEFARTYRAYEFTYTVGEDLVKAYVGNGPDRTKRFFDLLDRPVTPSMLRTPMN
jgi:hypothetical protein